MLTDSSTEGSTIATSHSRSDWLAGLAVGVAGGVLFWFLPLLGVLIIALLVAPVVLGRASNDALFGSLLGAGASSLVVLGQAIISCDRFDAAPNQGCSQPDLGPWLLGALLGLITGVAGSVVAVVGTRQRR